MLNNQKFQCGTQTHTSVYMDGEAATAVGWLLVTKRQHIIKLIYAWKFNPTSHRNFPILRPKSNLNGDIFTSTLKIHPKAYYYMDIAREICFCQSARAVTTTTTALFFCCSPIFHFSYFIYWTHDGTYKAEHTLCAGAAWMNMVEQQRKRTLNRLPI